MAELQPLGTPDFDANEGLVRWRYCNNGLTVR
jgi:hypothetical protein